MPQVQKARPCDADRGALVLQPMRKAVPMNDNLIHLGALTEVMERLLRLTENALASAEEGTDVADAIRSLWANLGVCPDAMTDACQTYSETCLEEVPELQVMALFHPDTLIAGAIARGICIGLILGRENPR